MGDKAKDLSTHSVQLKFEKNVAEFTVNSDELIMDAARRQGIYLANYCRQGGCGACNSMLLSGVVNYERKIKGVPQEPVVDDIVRPCSCCAQEDLILEPLSLWKLTD